MSEGVLRPGVVLGHYPERHEPDEFGLVPGFSALPSARRWMMRGFLRRVNHHEQRLTPLGGAAFSQEVKAIEYALRRRHDDRELPARAFAATRILAQRVLGQRPFDTQVLCGWVLFQGRLAEMATGEGKTLAAAMPAATAALTGTPVHLVTANDYLARRDALALKPLYTALGLSVGAAVAGMDDEERRAAYACDVTYCTSKQLVFDYLRDRLVLTEHPAGARRYLERLRHGSRQAPALFLRGLCYAIVDEADSVLIDEARTPFILSRMRPPEPAELYRRVLEAAVQMAPRREYTVDRLRREVHLTGRGELRVRELAAGLKGLCELGRGEELIRMAISAYTLFERDREYMVRDGAIHIVDDNTGRTQPDRAWENGLHQLLETKEGCDLTDWREPIARLTYQRFFRRYLRMAGMTGTAIEVAREIRSTYGLSTERIPTRLPVRRRARGVRVFGSSTHKWEQVVEQVKRLTQRGQPVLVGTRTVAAAERLSRALAGAEVDHRVLSASQDKDEAGKVAGAGEVGRVTVATNMAGRGTDIRLGPGVETSGGLHVIIAQCNDSRRIDRQLIGRCARQGDRGSFSVVLCVDEDLAHGSAARGVHGLWRRLGGGRWPLPGWIGSALVRAAQRRTERHHARLRRQVLALSEHLDSRLAFTGPPE